MSADGKEWTFKLREGVKFQDGHELTSADAAYTLRRVMNPATTATGAKDLSALKPENVIAKSRYELVLKSNTPFVDMPVTLAGPQFGIVPDGSTTEQLSSRTNGTGPFAIATFDPSAARVVMTANPGYWGAGRPKMKCLEISGITEPLSSLAAIQAGDVDILLAANPIILPSLREDPGIGLYPGDETLPQIIMQVDKAPFNDVRVRQALKLVVDREAMAAAVTAGSGYPANDNPAPFSSPFAFSTTPIPQDIEKAKALLAEAGQSNLAVDLYTGATDITPGALVFAQAYKEMASLAGVTVNIQTVPADSYWESVYMKRPMFMTYWGGLYPPYVLKNAYTTTGEANESDWKNPDFDKLVLAAESDTNQTSRLAKFKDIGALIAKDGGVIGPVSVPRITAVRKQCSGFDPSIVSFRQAFKDVECR
ncbi:hypothetical protein ASD12_23965 [Mesorhizobium sp. Root102]|nr:hypothetical protein ASD12_23965 [Mesorhizobium sp. Root102]